MANKTTRSVPASRSDSHDDWRSAYADLADACVDLADAYADLDRRQQSLTNDITTMKWVMGFGFGLVLITNGVIVALVVLSLSWIDNLRDDLHRHELGQETSQISEH